MDDNRSRFDISRVRLRQYRSIDRCDVKLGPLQILVGPNGSGKSNFVDSLRLVSQALNENLDNALRERGGATEVRRRSTGHPTHFGIRLNFRTKAFEGEYSFQIAALKGGDYKVSHESCRIAYSDIMRPDTFFTLQGGELTSSVTAVLPRVTDDRLFLVALSGLEEFRPVFDGLAGMNVYNLNPEVMRGPQKPDPGEVLSRDGANAASVLENLQRRAPAQKLQIEEYLRRIVPGVEQVSRRGYGSWESLEFRQSVAGAHAPWTFPATSMSDGTLRALGVLLALFSFVDGVRSSVAIEEPESALHPAAAGLLLDALRSASDGRQVIATTHSPDLLDSESIRPQELLAVRSLAGRTVVDKIEDASASAIVDSLYTPGELLRVDQLQPKTKRASNATVEALF